MPFDTYREFIFYRSYSRWNDELGRRETWSETVDRYMNFMRGKLQNKLTEAEYTEIRDSILKQEVVPSMRLMWAAGEAAERSNVTAYNCSYIAPTKLQDFGEILYILTCGSGAGFTVEKAVVNQLPTVNAQTNEEQKVHIIEDSKEGWATALVAGLTAWYAGGDLVFDYSFIRPAGARLKTMGGRASGPEPLRSLLDFARQVVIGAQGRKLRPIEVHDIICKIGDVVVAGGVRRSSEISLSDLDDTEMRDAKKGTFWVEHPQRSMANNSAIYNSRPTREQFDAEWKALVESGSGERGIFNRSGLRAQMPERRDLVDYMGTNPCGEITLRSKEFCNLTEVICRPDDTVLTLVDKIRIATILGTYQSTLTDFTYLSDEWKKNCDEERLLGVSITGQYDSPVARSKKALVLMKSAAVETNKEYAARFGINQSTSVTCVKPSGTVSQLVDAASGMHPRYAKYYVRRVRISATDPLFAMLRDAGVPYSAEVGQRENAVTYVLEFPQKAPENAITVDQVSAIDQLEYWKLVKTSYTEHNPSNTIYVRPDEWDQIAEWVWANFDVVGGLSFLPKDDHVYDLAPYSEITEQEYRDRVATFPAIDFSKLTAYEQEDNTEGAKTIACSSGVCEIA